MGDLKGKSKVLDPTLGDVKPLRQQLISALMQGIPGFQNSVFGMAQGGHGGYAPLDPSIVAPYQQLFATNRADALGQAKESAGNLTGSGYNNILGTATAGSLAQENAQLAQLGMQNQQLQFQQQQAFAQLLAGLGSQQGQIAYQPGFLDYATQGLAAAAPFITRIPGVGGGTPGGGGSGGRATYANDPYGLGYGR